MKIAETFIGKWINNRNALPLAERMFVYFNNLIFNVDIIIYTYNRGFILVYQREEI